MPDIPTDNFQRTLTEILSIPGVSKKQLAEWAGVDPSSVTRWHQGATPNDPVEVLRRLGPHVEKARDVAAAAAASVRRTELDSWRSLVGDMDPGLRQHVSQTGLLASTYHVFAVWDPASVSGHECDVVILRYFSNVWADTSRRLYNIGDVEQTVTIDEHTDGAAPAFGQAEAIGGHARFMLKWEKELAPGLARLHVQLDLTELQVAPGVIAIIEDFGYRYRAKRAIVRGRTNVQQTNEFLGAPVVLPCRRFRFVVCVPRASVVGAPSALSYSNRAMLRSLLAFDKMEPEAIESLMWPLGRRYELSSAPDAQLRTLPHVETVVDTLPRGLQEALSGAADLENPDQTIHEVLRDPSSVCFLLDLHQPPPWLIHTIAWRLSEIEMGALREP